MWTTAGTRSFQAAARPRMPAFELWVWTTSGFRRRNACAEQAVGPSVGPWPDGADQFGHDLDLQAQARGPLEEVPFGAFGRAGDEGHVVAVAVVQALDGQEGVLLGAAEDQAGDDVDDLHKSLGRRS